MEIRLRSSLPGAFPVVKDLVDRSAFDRIQHAGGFISVNTSGNPVDANAIPINKGC
jgi:succinate dehydrogenase / fumarate reductase iron-sulfur subunit